MAYERASIADPGNEGEKERDVDRRRRRYLDGFATGHQVLLYDDLTVHEIVESLVADGEDDWTLGPWRSGYQAAIRSAFGL